MQRIILITCLTLFSLTQGCIKNKVSKNTLNIALDSEPRSIDPRYAVDANSQYIDDLIHCSLMTFESNGSVVGDLAKSWKWTSAKKLSMTLKEDIQFSDGTIVTAKDVKATYDFFSKKDLKKRMFRNINQVCEIHS